MSGKNITIIYDQHNQPSIIYKKKFDNPGSVSSTQKYDEPKNIWIVSNSRTLQSPKSKSSEL